MPCGAEILKKHEQHALFNIKGFQSLPSVSLKKGFCQRFVHVLSRDLALDKQQVKQGSKVSLFKKKEEEKEERRYFDDQQSRIFVLRPFKN